MRPIMPRGYVCYRARSPLQIDGRGDDPAWADAPWTDDFVDIQGPTTRPTPRFRTRAKMLWDDQAFYVYAELQEPHVWGTITRKNEIIFHDPDFEVFIDPDGDNHHYYEFEMNALNTIWELTLDKPYRDGGPAHHGTNLPGLRSAVHIDGTLNNPSDTDRGWSVEIVFPWADLARYAGAMPCPPRDADQWRVDFSRVEWLFDIIDGKYRKIPPKTRPEDNWVWSPQGVIDMHRPERWGFVQFSTASPGSATFHPDPALAARDELMEVYYRQREYHRLNHRYAATLQDLGITSATISLTARPNGYVATTEVKLPDGSARTLSLGEDSRLEVKPEKRDTGVPPERAIRS